MPLSKAISVVLMAFLFFIAIMVTAMMIIDPEPPFYRCLASCEQFFVVVYLFLI